MISDSAHSGFSQRRIGVRRVSQPYASKGYVGMAMDFLLVERQEMRRMVVVR